MEDEPVLSGCVCDGTVNCPLARLERAVLDEHGVRGPGFKQFIARRRRKDAANASINRELAILKRAFHLAAANDPPRVYRIPHFPMLDENNVRKGFLEEDAYKRLRDALPSGVQLLFVVAYHVGCRVGELLKIRWSQVDLHAKRIRLEPGTRKEQAGAHTSHLRRDGGAPAHRERDP